MRAANGRRSGRATAGRRRHDHRFGRRLPGAGIARACRRRAARISMRPSIAIEGDRGNRDAGNLEKRLERLLNAAADVAGREHGDLLRLDRHARSCRRAKRRFSNVSFRARRSAVSAALPAMRLEAQFHARSGAWQHLPSTARRRFRPSTRARKADGAARPEAAIVTTVGHQRGEGVAVLSAEA